MGLSHVYIMGFLIPTKFRIFLPPTFFWHVLFVLARAFFYLNDAAQGFSTKPHKFAPKGFELIVFSFANVTQTTKSNWFYFNLF